MAKKNKNIGIRKAIFQEVTYTDSVKEKFKSSLCEYYGWKPEQVDELLKSCDVKNNGSVFSVWLPLFSRYQKEDGFEKGDFGEISIWYKPIKFSSSEFIFEEVIAKLQMLLTYIQDGTRDSLNCIKRSACEPIGWDACDDAIVSSESCFDNNEGKEMTIEKNYNVNSCPPKEHSEKNDFRTIVNDVIHDLKFLKEDSDHAKHADLNKQKEELETKYNNALDKQKEELETKYNNALDKQKEELETKYNNALDKQKEELETKYNNALDKQKEELETKHNNALDKQKEELETKHNNALDKQKEDFDSKIKIYQSQLILEGGSLQEYARKLVAFFEACKDLSVGVSRALNTSEFGVNDNDVDTYNYYIVRNNRKYEQSISQIKNYNSFVQEVSLLAQTGMILRDGFLNNTFFGNGTITMKKESTLQLLAYREFVKKMASASIIMGDEYAFLIPGMVESCTENKFRVFADFTKKIREKVIDLGFSISYARPNEPVGSMNVEIVDYKKVNGWDSGNILEIKELAINFDNSQSKTKVVTCE